MIMIKDNQRFWNGLHVVLDACVIGLSYVLAWYIRFKFGVFSPSPWYLSLQEYCRVLLFVIPGYLILYYIFSSIRQREFRGGGWRSGISLRPT